MTIQEKTCAKNQSRKLANQKIERAGNGGTVRRVYRDYLALDGGWATTTAAKGRDQYDSMGWASSSGGYGVVCMRRAGHGGLSPPVTRNPHKLAGLQGQKGKSNNSSLDKENYSSLLYVRATTGHITCKVQS